ncbi:MAG: TOMM precursor leader peptide-binding protein [Pseudomonadota bacterium]|nr:TOMM precursor leader peptide-binding protein [Pseudomonadota bacterium]
MSLVDTSLLLSGGADESYWLDELPDTTAAQAVLAAWHAAPETQPSRWQALLADARTAAAVRQLRHVGALVPASALTTPARLVLHWLGEPLPALQAALTALPGLELTTDDDAGDDTRLTVVIRSNAPWPQALAAYQQAPPRGTHLLVDLAHHHTLCIGPLVVPGDTACVACLGHRIAHRWGEAPLPPVPAAQAAWPLVAALLAQALHASTGQRTRLAWIEQTTSLNLHTLTSQREAVYRQPHCPVCGASALPEPATSGRLDLPWAAPALT